MPVVRRLRLLRSVVAVASAAVVLPLLAPTAVASAEDAVTAGDTVVGELVRVWAEPESHDEAAEGIHTEPLTWIEPDNGEAVRVLTDEVEAVPVGATVEVTVGEELVDVASSEEGIQPARDVLSAEVVEPAPAATEEPTTAEAATPLTNEVTVAMVVPSGGVQDGTTLTQVVDAVNGPVARFWSNESQGAISVGVTAAHDWSATVAPGLSTTTASCADYLALWQEVADRVGFTAGPGKHLMLYVTSTPAELSGCAYGLAQVGAGPSSGGRLYVRATATSLIAHELGHNFGLGHSSALQCDGTVESGTCATREYYDLYDVMGASWEQLGSLSASHAARLRVLPDAQQKTVKASDPGGLVTLAPFGGRSGVRTVRLVDPDGIAYWLEYRTPTGQDSWLGSSGTNPFGLDSGVVVRRALSGNDTSLLLDGTPSRASGWGPDVQTGLPLQQEVPISGGDFNVTVVGASSSEATVRIVTARAPVGALDAVSVSGATLTVRGWTFDPNTPEQAGVVHLYIGGRGVALTANGSRPDVGAAFPVAGSLHGFSFSTRLAPGVHNVCAYALDTSGVGNTVLGCRSVTFVSRPPLGSLDSVSVSADGRLTVRGWGMDPDTPTISGQVHVYVDGRGVSVTADGSRPDVAAAFPAAGSAHGFTFSTPVLAGPRRACAYAIDTSGAGSVLLGCRSVTYVPRLPVGSLDAVSVSEGTLTIRGWAFDPDTPTTSGQVHIYVGTTGTAVTANESRPDVGAAFPHAGNGHGYTFSTPVSAGSHRACAYAIDTSGGGSTLLGCRTVTS